MPKAVLLLNLGTPAEPTAKGLRAFYRHFFADPFVFDMNPVARWLLRNLIIMPFRAPKTAKSYASIWMDEGSPLKVYADRLQSSVQQAFDEAGEEVLVLNGMAYSEPFIHQALQELEEKGVNDILILPLFPQYSTATTASVFHEVKRAAGLWKQKPNLHFVNDLFAEPAFIRAWSILITKHLEAEKIDHVVFSYHGLPERTIKKAISGDVCQFGDCCEQIGESNRYCYRAQCIATTQSIVKALGWGEERYSLAFQSRFDKQAWIQPYLDEHLAALVEKGVKKIAVVTPSFVSDCLETIHEIGIDYRQEFIDNGGEVFQLIPNLNDDPAWFSSVFEISRAHLQENT
ncbi:MAG: ferrochelatase [SAR86 cluster bacterium]|uniref:Ferrochelatase n=1 Tax=SAR86 cluster bacterium TaxID=2030880 RepID=A0A2A5AU71_9GAMM|nr:MAG: ferrochelatase [SAR86 cluster bacterium]